MTIEKIQNFKNLTFWIQEQLDKGNVCYGDFNRHYNKKYVQPIKQRVLRVLTQWVRDDPFNEMKKPLGGGVMLYERINSWVPGSKFLK